MFRSPIYHTWPQTHSHSRLIIIHLSIILDHNCNFILRVEESSRAGKMIFRDNKSCDCGVNEVTAYKGREDSGTHRSLFLKLETDGYPIRAIEGQVAVAQIALPGSHFPEVPLPLPPILPDAIFPRWIISYSIANYRMLSGRRFLTWFDLSGISERIENKFGNDQTIHSRFNNHF